MVLDDTSPGWAEKKQRYKDAMPGEKLWKHFVALREVYRAQTGGNHARANRRAQEDCDLILKDIEKGNSVALPDVKRAVVGGDILNGRINDNIFVDRKDFGAIKKPNPLADIDWIYANLSIKDVKPQDAPNPGAYVWLKLVQANTEEMLKFLNTVYAKRIPSKAELDKESQFRDDDRKVIFLVEAYEQEMNQEAGDGSD